MEIFLKYYHQLSAVLFISIDNTIPSKMYGKFIGLGQGLVCFVCVLFLYFLEWVILALFRKLNFDIVNIISSELYLTIGIILLFFLSYLTINEDDLDKEYFKIGKELKKAKKYNSIFYSFWITLGLLMYFVYLTLR